MASFKTLATRLSTLDKKLAKASSGNGDTFDDRMCPPPEGWEDYGFVQETGNSTSSYSKED
jgi:hypothetical protein